MQMHNPFPRVAARYGAPMGRHGDAYDQLADWPSDVPLYAEHCGGDGYYDRGGAYWGHSGVTAVYTAETGSRPMKSALLDAIHDLASLAAIAAFCIFVGLVAVAMAPCETEDSNNCRWDAETQGNGHGRSFVNVAGVVVPL